MKLHIMYDFKSGAWGGGNQFLKALRDQWSQEGLYTDDANSADAIIFNSYPFSSEYLFSRIFKLKKKQHNKVILNRVDGPIATIRGKDREIDSITYYFSKYFCDGTVFQSLWCKEHNEMQGYSAKIDDKVIINAPNPDIFNNKGLRKLDKRRKIRLIATSWSNNWRKGFAVYQWLDRHLNYNKYEFVFIGNSPIQFENIRIIKPLSSKELAKQLHESDIFITASEKDPCSNSLLEALHCGLPAIGLQDGGHPELIGQGGRTFQKAGEIPAILEDIVQNYQRYQRGISLPDIAKVASEYRRFAEAMQEKNNSGHTPPQRPGSWHIGRLMLMVYFWKIRRYLRNRFINSVGMRGS